LKLAFYELINSFRRPKDEKARNKLYVFFICLAISVFIWFLIVLSEDYYSTLDYPLVYKNIPEKLELKNKPDSILSLRVSTGGFDLTLLKYLSRKRPIEVDLAYLRLEKGNDGHFTASLDTRQLAQPQISRLGLSQTAVSIYPEIIHFDFEIQQTRMVKVIPDIDLKFEKQFYLSDSLQLIPDSIELIGVGEVIAAIDFIKTERSSVLAVNSNRSIELAIDKSGLPAGVKLSQDKVSLAIKVDKYTEDRIELPVSLASYDGMKIKTFPASVEVTYLVALKDYKRVESTMFSATVNYTDVSSDQRKLKVVISRKPSFIKILKVIPEKVEFLVLTK
jgi:hypothetical protein